MAAKAPSSYHSSPPSSSYVASTQKDKPLGSPFKRAAERSPPLPAASTAVEKTTALLHTTPQAHPPPSQTEGNSMGPSRAKRVLPQMGSPSASDTTSDLQPVDLLVPATTPPPILSISAPSVGPTSTSPTQEIAQRSLKPSKAFCELGAPVRLNFVDFFITIIERPFNPSFHSFPDLFERI